MKTLEKIKKANAGKWLALKGNNLIAASKDFHELHQILKQKDIKESIQVIRSPLPEEKKYGFLLCKLKITN